MAKVTIYSEPLIERYGAGFSEDDQKIQTYSGDALNMAGAIARGLEWIGKNNKSEDHEISVLCGLGDDTSGNEIKNFMSKEGISTKHTVTLKGRKTATYIINRKEDGKSRSVDYVDRGIDSPMCQLMENGEHASRVKQIMEHVGKNTDILVVTGIGASRARSDDAFDRLITMIRNVKARGGMVIVDFNHRVHADGKAKLWVNDDGTSLPNEEIRMRMDRLFALADISFVAHDELAPVYGHLYDPPLKIGQDAPDAGPIVSHLIKLQQPEGHNHHRYIFFKRGKEGGTLFRQNDNGADVVVHTVSKEVPVIDRNGGGDALIGGTIAAFLSGYTLDQSVHVGQKMASE